MRDSQRQRVYDAEAIIRGMFDYTMANDNPTVEVHGITLTLPPEAKFASVDAVQAYCNRVTATVGAYPVLVRRRRGAAKAHYERWDSTIAVPDNLGSWAMREIVVLHELAHHLSPGGHGPEFVSAFIDLVGRIMGPEVALLMRVVFDKEGVRTHAETKVTK